MATLVYAPAIRVHVRTEKHGILDISEDIAQWELIRRSNTVSSFNFILQNSDRKYDGMFTPSDALTVELKRFTWVRVFTGTLNSVPLFSAWPRALPMSASCTLKKLQFWPWNPETIEAQNMIQGVMNNIVGAGGSGAPGSDQGGLGGPNTRQGDAGLSRLITTALTRVTDWDPKAIHIGAVPNEWFKWASDTEQAIDLASNMASVLGQGASIAGSSTYGNLVLQPGTYNTYKLIKSQCDLITDAFVQVAGTIPVGGKAQQDLLIQCVIAIGLMMTKFVADGSPAVTRQADLKGVYGMSPRWGMGNQRTEFSWGTNALIHGGNNTSPGLLQMKDRQNTDPKTLCIKVMPELRWLDVPFNSNFITAYGAAQEIVKQLRKQVSQNLQSAAQNPVNTSPVLGGSSLPSGAGGKWYATGDMVASVAKNLILNHPHTTTDPITSLSIKYDGSESASHSDHAGAPTNPNPTHLDCSALADWVYYNATGHMDVWERGSTRTIIPTLKDLGPDWRKYAPNIRGVIPYYTGGHIGVGIGNGLHVAAHDVQEGVNISSLLTGGFDGAGLAPHIDYTSSATNQETADFLTKLLGQKCTVSPIKQWTGLTNSNAGTPSGGGAADPAQELVSIFMSSPTAPTGNIFGGARLLMNNSPFLPWIANVTNSSMRAFCSAPNGDFIAWFPDYFDVWNILGKMTLRPIELQDFTVDWSDQQLVTHEFVLGSIQPTFDTVSGGVVQGGTADYQQQYAMLYTDGIASMDFPQIFKTIYGKPASAKFTKWYLERFGARPNVEQLPNIVHGPQEFYMALWLFMKHWAEQFNARIPMTFMPELWPGMIVQIEEFGFQAYVSEVRHTGTYGPNGQFTTEATIIAPAPIDKNERGSIFNILDVVK